MTYVDVTHEALIREWPTLRDWLSEDREGLRVHRKLTEAAQEWAQAGPRRREHCTGAYGCPGAGVGGGA